MRGRLLGVFPCGDVCGRLAGGVRDVRVVGSDVCLGFACIARKVASCPGTVDGRLGMGAQSAEIFGKIFPSV